MATKEASQVPHAETQPSSPVSAKHGPSPKNRLNPPSPLSPPPGVAKLAPPLGPPEISRSPDIQRTPPSSAEMSLPGIQRTLSPAPGDPKLTSSPGPPELSKPPDIQRATTTPEPINPAKRKLPPESTEKVETTYRQLSRAGIELNTASDALGKPIQVWEAGLKKLNLGVSAWVELSSGGDDREHWWDRAVGYTKLKDRWGIALRTREGHFQFADDDSEEFWPFNEAPRWIRIEGVGKLPELLEALLKQAEDTTKKLRAKAEQANELAEAISRVADEMAALTEGK